jgi:quinol-cytochrome oxidoreductase complex cytochrome b subunit
LTADPRFLASAVNLNHPGHYYHWGFILISVANLVVIVVMVALFVAALFLPFVAGRAVHSPAGSPLSPAAGGHLDEPGAEAEADPAERTWTGGVRRLGLRYLPPGKLLPDAQPAYVASWVYVFGVLTIAALVVVVASGLVLALFGPAWWHTSFVGHFVNSMHLWSVELFMGFMVIHLWAKFWMAAWRGGRAFTWMSGVVCFLVAVFEAFTGYLSQTNFDSQWIAFEAKDGLNSGGIGAYFNTMNFGQALMLHIALIPLALVAIVALHVLLVRVHGVVPPIDALPEHLGMTDHDEPPRAERDPTPPDGGDALRTSTAVEAQR